MLDIHDWNENKRHLQVEELYKLYICIYICIYIRLGRSELWSPRHAHFKVEALKSSDATLRDVAFGLGKAGVVLLEVTLIGEVMLDCDVLLIYIYI